MDLYMLDSESGDGQLLELWKRRLGGSYQIP